MWNTAGLRCILNNDNKDMFSQIVFHALTTQSHVTYAALHITYWSSKTRVVSYLPVCVIQTGGMLFANLNKVSETYYTFHKVLFKE